ncbi:uncharacterized protein L969DRAFT_53991 [Mixia osmundae IAM 14324]|uniref:Glutathione hydrolase n=1 Tax=Mixia osmundae (strain CBS 9802 / IAM 14324 / JCM 22182 / KY 12970) TaxID=764103 RepID=G7E2N5_MIXOS|nr:uncharacterized protein L969DRAFT_53991 [Mixia osmundae IAM 14324]KEI36960.1 hypothetical protein L969DRAFT_53991 [Mixia osmundae IAM 14324]GAA97095.1 hypothetical protein E5Q_03770 [Mixia osmundae IAM 14324]
MQQMPDESEPLLSQAGASDAEAERGQAGSLIGQLRRRKTYVGYAIVSSFVSGFLILLIVLIAQEAHSGSPDSPAETKPVFPQLPKPQPGLRNPAYLVRGRHGAVAAESGICSDVGVDVLKENGTATDAAIAATLCIGVVDMFSSGIGGGGFLVIRPPDCIAALDRSACPVPISIDFRETAPEAAHPRMFADNALASKFGGLAIGTPGELRGLQAAYQAYGGGVSWRRLFEPSIEIADKGWPATDALINRLKLFGAWMLDAPEWAEIFAPAGDFLRPGELIRRPALARTLRTVADKGADAFYKGAIAHSIVETTRAAGGILTKADLANYKAVVEQAARGTYRNRTIYTTQLPSSGPILISLLNTLEPLDLLEQGRTVKNIHIFLEALKFSFAHRTHFGDPAFHAQPAYLAKLMTKQFGRETLANITGGTHSVSYYNPLFDVKTDHGTMHLSVVDAHGSAVSLTSTVNLPFGSRVMDRETGVILNDEMDDFATPGVPDYFGLEPSPFNYPEARAGLGKRPLSSTSAVLMDDADGKFLLALGGSGGSRIYSAVAQVILNLDWGQDLSAAIQEPRVHDQLLPTYVSVEGSYSPGILAGLAQRGHRVELFDINIGIAAVQAVQKLGGWFYAASDSRKWGRAAAY